MINHRVSEAPTNADIEKINDILFGSQFTDNKDEVNETNHIYLGDAGLKILTSSTVHKTLY